ncbi:MAG: glycosyltransferase [Chloroflexi bacterium]|nr:glycosyltransferase [Chloroflexota bacterium]
MKVLHIYKNYYPMVGGIESHLRLLCRHLARQPDLEVSILVANTGRRTVIEQDDGVRLIRAGQLFTLARTPLSWSLFRWVARLPADIIHLHSPYPWGELSYLLAGRSRGMVLTYHSDIIRQKGLLRLYEPFLWRVLERADRLIASSPNYIETSPYLRRFSSKCVAIPPGIELQRFQRVDETQVQAIRQCYGTPIVLFVGQYRYYKGLDILLQAMAGLSIKLLFIGPGLAQNLQSRVHLLRLEDRVHFLGEIPDADLPAYYHACDVFVLPAVERSEAFGLVQLEAMACGKPLVCTELGTGTSYVNIHEETGLVVEPGNPTALGQAIERLLSDPLLYQRLSQGAIQRVTQHFRHDIMVQRTLELYRKILSDS